MRILLVSLYNGADFKKIMFTLPSSLNYEEFILNVYLKILISLKNRKKTNIYEDNMILEKSKNPKEIFSVIYRKGQKEILEEQIKIVKLLLKMIQKIKMGSSFSEVFLEKFDEFEDDKYFLENRLRILNYMKMLYMSSKKELL